MKRPVATAMTAFAAISAITVLACLAATSARPSTADTAGESAASSTRITDVPGHVVEVMDDAWGLQPDEDEGTRYDPDDLPEDFRIDGLPVIFSGEVGEIPPNARLWGTPLHLTDIRRRDDG